MCAICHTPKIILSHWLFFLGYIPFLNLRLVLKLSDVFPPSTSPWFLSEQSLAVSKKERKTGVAAPFALTEVLVCSGNSEKQRFQKVEIQFFFFFFDEFWQNKGHSIGNYKSAKTGRQCMSLMEKTEFQFFEIPIFPDCRLFTIFLLFRHLFQTVLILSSFPQNSLWSTFWAKPLCFVFFSQNF